MKTENLDHLGLVAGVIDELGLVELLDEVIEPHCLEHVSAGQVVKAMLLNALGFLSAPLYLFSQLTHVSVNPVRAKRASGRPAKAAEPTPVQGYQLQAVLERQATTEQTVSRQRSRFILATNQLDKSLWPAQKLLKEYKGQQTKEQNQTVGDQCKQPTAKPTFRWIMQKFQGIHWLNLQGQPQITNLTDERQLIIRLFGPPVERYYYASG